jgi:hypothetical protein
LAAAAKFYNGPLSDRPLCADIVDLIVALFRAPPFSESWSIFWGVVSGSGLASAPISLEPSCRHGASGWHRSKLCELSQILSGGREQLRKCHYRPTGRNAQQHDELAPSH